MQRFMQTLCKLRKTDSSDAFRMNWKVKSIAFSFSHLGLAASLIIIGDHHAIVSIQPSPRHVRPLWLEWRGCHARQMRTVVHQLQVLWHSIRQRMLLCERVWPVRQEYPVRLCLSVSATLWRSLGNFGILVSDGPCESENASRRCAAATGSYFRAGKIFVSILFALFDKQDRPEFQQQSTRQRDN